MPNIQYGLLLLKTQDRLPKKFIKLVRDGLYELRTEYGDIIATNLSGVLEYFLKSTGVLQLEY